MKQINYIIKPVFFVSTILAYALLFIPIKYKVEIYSPSVWGYFWLLVTIPVSLISLIYLSYIDIRKKRYKSLIKRFIFYAFILVLFVITWIYLSNSREY